MPRVALADGWLGGSRPPQPHVRTSSSRRARTPDAFLLPDIWLVGATYHYYLYYYYTPTCNLTPKILKAWQFREERFDRRCSKPACLHVHSPPLKAVPSQPADHKEAGRPVGVDVHTEVPGSVREVAEPGEAHRSRGCCVDQSPGPGPCRGCAHKCFLPAPLFLAVGAVCTGGVH
jgi:hypothetical protein